MLKLTRRTFAATLGIALMAMLALPIAVFANTTEAIAQTGGMTVTLPMPGSGLSVVVKLDVVGNVSQVDLDPVGTYTAKRVGPHAVTFDSSDGTSSVRINAKGDKLAVKASAPTLETFLGSGTWSADVFGTGDPTNVGYTVGGTAAAPTITINSVAAPADIAVVQGTPKTHTSSKGSSASVGVAFSQNGFTKRLSLSISVKATGAHAASLKISLSGRDKQKLTGTLAELVGTRTWAGHLCDGTAVGFSYDVAADGTVAFGAATGAPATAKAKHGGLRVKFDGTKTRVDVRLHEKQDGTFALKVSARTSHCRHTSAADPTVNTPVSPDADKVVDRGRGHGGHGNDGNGHGGQSGASQASSRSGGNGQGGNGHGGDGSQHG